MTIGDKLFVHCSDGKARTGRIIYIHPDGIFVTLEFEGRGGNWREAFLLARPWKEPKHEDEIDESLKSIPMARFTPDEDRMLLNSGCMVDTARDIGRTLKSCYARRGYLRKKKRRKHG